MFQTEIIVLIEDKRLRKSKKAIRRRRKKQINLEINMVAKLRYP